MSADKRSVATDALATLGTIHTEEHGRDAIHLAVIQRTASGVLHAGQHVNADGKTDVLAACVGIVDPFLREPVAPGDRFWLVIYPRVITSLRHVWTHPAFPAEAGAPNRSESETWMRRWAMVNMGRDYYYGDGDFRSEDAAYADAIQAGHDLNIGPYEDARESIDDTWWSHWEAITGGRGQRGEYFSCAC